MERSSHPEMFLGKDALEICSKFTGENSCRSVISIKLLCNFIEITFWYGCSPINFAAYFQNTFSSERLWVAASAWSYKVVLENHKDVLGSRKF